MTTPDSPLRFEFSVEVPGIPEQVWDAIATGNGISSWMMPTDVEERVGGAVSFHMGPDVSSDGTVTGWDPPRRLVFEEPNWAELVGQDPATVTPLVSEFLIEAKSGGTCVVRVVSSAFGSGAEWEREFFDNMAQGWTPMFDNLRLYLTHFAGRNATPLDVYADVPGTPAGAVSAIRRALGAEREGLQIDVRGATAVVERLADESLVLRLTDPVEGLLGFYGFKGDDAITVRLAGYLFSDDAPGYVEREQPAWRAWLEQVGATAGER